MSIDLSSTPSLEFTFEAEGSLAPPVDVGPGHLGQRRIVPIGTGRFEGPLLAGEVMPGGVDWQVHRGDGVIELEARYVLRTDDGVLIPVINRGLRHAPADVMQAMARGERVPASAYYFRTVPRFEAPPGRHEWLNRSIFICSGERRADSIRLRVYRVT